MGATTNEGDPSHQHGSSLEEPMLEPSLLLPTSTIDLLGERTAAGRAGIAARIRTRPGLSPGLVHDLPAVGELEVVVDRERAILLSLTRRLDGEPYETSELVEVAFDESFPPETFAFRPPPGETVTTTRERQSLRRALPLHEVARGAPFRVLAAPRIPADWEVWARLLAADERLGTPPSVHLFYVSSDGGVRINVNERAATGAAPSRAPDGSEWTMVERGDRELRAWEPADAVVGMPRTVVVEHAGTRAHLTSADLELSALLDFAAALAPASGDPPRLP